MCMIRVIRNDCRWKMNSGSETPNTKANRMETVSAPLWRMSTIVACITNGSLAWIKFIRDMNVL